MIPEFKPWPKTPRLFRDITITEKIDGTNAAVQIHTEELGTPEDPTAVGYVVLDDVQYVLHAQSRNRIITPGSDNAGFAKWVQRNKKTLVQDLGTGIHFGEWWGQGIQRGYGLDHKRFSLFNTSKWSDREFETLNLGTVPVLYEGPMAEGAILIVADGLRQYGSVAVEGYKDAEGIVVYHHAANSVFKVLLENDDLPKSVLLAENPNPKPRRGILARLGLR